MGVFKDALAEFGDGEAARTARQQAFAEAAFERADAPRQRRFGQADALGGAGETAAVYHVGEEDEVVGVEFHGGLLFHWWNDDTHFNGFRCWIFVNRMGSMVKAGLKPPPPTSLEKPT